MRYQTEPRPAGSSGRATRLWTAAFIATVLALPAAVWCGSTVDREYTRGESSRWWPTATARVLSSKWEEHTSCDQDGCTDEYDLHLAYEYEVGEERYKGTRYRFGWPTGWSKGDVKSIVAKYPAGKRVPVHYDPYDPGVSTLRPGLSWFGFIVTLVFVAGAVIALWGVAFAAIAHAFNSLTGRRDSPGRREAWGAHLDHTDDWEGPGRLGDDTSEPR